MGERQRKFWKIRELGDLLKVQPLPVCREIDFEKEITGVATDSRTIADGELFIALTGQNFDGHDFVGAAIANGAAAVVVDGATTHLSHWAQRYPQTFFLPVADTMVTLADLARARLTRIDPIVIAVTGSNGKTTTKEMLAEILKPHFRVHKTAGNFNNNIGLPLTIFAMPDECQVAVLEMGMNAPGEIAVLAAIATPDYAVITNVARAHLQGLGSREAVARAKCEVISGLKPGATVIYNSDDPYLKRLVPETVQACKPALSPELLPVSEHGAAETAVKASEIWLTDEGMSFVFKREAEAVTVKLPCWGRHNVMNAVLALAAGTCLAGISPVSAANSITSFKLPAGRLEKHEIGGGGILLHDAYNANPESMLAALTTVSERRGKKFLALVLGDMNELGTESENLHRQIGEKVAEIRPDLLVLLGNYVSEIACSTQAAGLPSGRVTQFPVGDFTAAAAFLQAQLPAGALILVKGSRALTLEKIVNPLIAHFEARK